MHAVPNSRSAGRAVAMIVEFRRAISCSVLLQKRDVNYVPKSIKFLGSAAKQLCLARASNSKQSAGFELRRSFIDRTLRSTA